MTDVFPDNDVAIANGLRRLCGAEPAHTEVASVYSPFRSYLYLHIWGGVDLKLIIALGYLRFITPSSSNHSISVTNSSALITLYFKLSVTSFDNSDSRMA